MKITFTEAAERAANLPKLASDPIYQDLDGNEMQSHFTVIYGTNEPSAVDMFLAQNHGRQYKKFSNISMYVVQSKIGENGNILPKGVYAKKLMCHRKWARKDYEVKLKSYDIVGLKRESSKLGAAVLVSNIEYDI